MYLVATGPESGSPVVLMTALGTCGSLNAATTVTINEATTIASAFSLAQFASIGTHGIDIGAPATQDSSKAPKCDADAQDNWQSTGPKTCNYIGLKNAFATVQNLVDIPTGAALSITPYYKNHPGAGAGYNISQVPQARINALANVLASCANPSSTTCTDLFTATKVGSTTPIDTLQAALNIAQNPGANVSAIYDLISIVPPFTTSLSAAPGDWGLAVVYQGAGLTSLHATGLAVDAQGNLWVPIANISEAPSTSASGAVGGTDGLVAVFNNLGAPISPSATSSTEGGYNGNGAINNPQSIAIDRNGYAWIGNYPSAAGSTAGSVAVLDVNGNVKFGSPYMNSLLFLPHQGGMAVDASNNVWVSSNVGNSECNSGQGPWGGSILELSTTDENVSPTGTVADYVSSDNSSCPTFLAIDQNGSMWTQDQGNWQGGDSALGGSLDLFSTTSGTLAGGPYFNEGPFSPPNVAMGSFANAWFSVNLPGVKGLAKMANLTGTKGDNSSSVGDDPTVFLPTALSQNFGTFPSTVAIDGNSDAWVVGVGPAGLYEINNDDTALAPLSPTGGFTGYDNNGLKPIGDSGGGSYYTAVDNSGNVWLVSPGDGSLAEFVGIGVPVPTPLAAGLASNNLGQKP